MNEDEIKLKLNQVFCQVFRDDTLVISKEMSSAHIDGWDSMSHVNLILEVEDTFQIEFSKKELMKQKNIGDLLSNIQTKLLNS